MKKALGIFLSLLLIFLVGSSSIFAGKKEGLMTEFRTAEENLRNKKDTPEEKLKLLEANLVRAMSQAIDRHNYYNRVALKKDLSPATIDYENPSSALVYYVKFKDYLVRVDYALDPMEYIQSPKFEKIIYLGELSPHDQAQP